MTVATLVRTLAAVDYGLRADGRTDDAPRLVDAVNAAVAQGGARVLLPVASVVLLASTVVVPTGVELVVPISCVVRLAPGAVADLLSLGAGTKLSGGGTIDGNRATQATGTPAGVVVTGSDVLIDDVLVTSCRGNGITIGAVARVEVRGVTVTDCGSHGIELAGSTRCVVANSAAYDNGRVLAAGQGDGVRLSGAASDNAVLGLLAYDGAGAGGRQGYAVREAAGMTGDRNVMAAVAGQTNVLGIIATVGALSGIQAGSPTGAASGALAGTYPSPTIAVGAVGAAAVADGSLTDAEVAAANKDGAAGTVSLRSLGTGAQQAMPGPGSRPVRSIAVSTVGALTDGLVKATGAITYTLPSAAATYAGQEITVKKMDAGTTTTVNATGGQTIDGAASVGLTVQNQSMTFSSDGANWLVT